MRKERAINAVTAIPGENEVRARVPARFAAVADVAPTMHVRVTSATDIDDSLRQAWADLAADAAEPNSFAEAWFVEPGLRALSAPGDVRLLHVWSGSRLAGIVPLTTEDKYGRVPFSHVENWKHANSFLGTPLIRRGVEVAVWAQVLGSLDAAEWAPGFLHLDGLVEHGPVHDGLIAAATALSRPCDTVYREVRALLASQLSPEAYYADTVRKKKRKELGRLARRLGDLGTVSSQTLDDAADLTGWCDAFLALEHAGWKGRAGSSLASEPAKERFFREALAGAFAAGRLEFRRMDLDGRPIAMLVNFIAPPGSFSFKTAFHEDYARFSPGVLIQLDNMALLERDDIDWMDSCAAQDHPMIDSLWGERRAVVRVTVPLSGLRRGAAFKVARALENGSARWRASRTKERSQ